MASDLRIDTDNGFIESGQGERISLTRSERRALDFLSKRPRRVLSRDQILDAVSEPGSEKNDRNVDFLINRLRRKLSDDAKDPRFIATRYGEGYVWVAGASPAARDIAGADVVVGPVIGLQLVPDIQVARHLARDVYAALCDAFGAEFRVVYAPDCPSASTFVGDAPRYAAELTFLSDRGQESCILAMKDFKGGQLLSARRLAMNDTGCDHDTLHGAARAVVDDIWRSRIAVPSHGDPLQVAMVSATEGEEPPLRKGLDTASHRSLLTKFRKAEEDTLTTWRRNEARLRTMLAASPDDPELKLLTALSIQSRYVAAGPRLFETATDDRPNDEAEIERLVTEALPMVRDHPEYAIIAGKLLYFIQRGYDDLALDIAERAYARSTAIGSSLPVIGQLRAFFGETEAALQCLDQALNIVRPGSHAHLYALVIKCQVLAAAARWDELCSAQAEIAGTSRLGGFMMGPLFHDPCNPPMSAKALVFLLSRRRAFGLLMLNHYVAARLFRDPQAGVNLLRPVTQLVVDRFGRDVVPDEIRVAHPTLMAALS